MQRRRLALEGVCTQSSKSTDKANFPLTVNDFVTKKHISSVSDALTTARNKLIAIARSNVMLTYNLVYPPEGSKEPPDAYRVRIVAALIGEHPRKLLFMHKYTLFSHELYDNSVFALSGCLRTTPVYVMVGSRSFACLLQGTLHNSKKALEMFAWLRIYPWLHLSRSPI
jgi:hypothetical protein